MATTRSSTAVGAVLTLLAAMTLAGCAAEAAPEPSPTPSAAEPTPEPSVEPEETDDALFTVSAKVRAVDGTTIDISLSGHSPVASTDPEASDLVSEFIELCSAMDGRSVSDVASPVSEDSLAQFGASLMKLEYTSTPEGRTFFAPVDLTLGSLYYAEVASGDGILTVESNDTCTGRYQLTGSGSGTAIAEYESGNTTPDLGQWRYGHYGFSVPFESGATIEACRVVVGDLALEDVADIPGWDPGSDATGISCGIGYAGE